MKMKVKTSKTRLDKRKWRRNCERGRFRRKVWLGQTRMKRLPIHGDACDGTAVGLRCCVRGIVV